MSLTSKEFTQIMLGVLILLLSNCIQDSSYLKIQFGKNLTNSFMLEEKILNAILFSGYNWIQCL